MNKSNTPIRNSTITSGYGKPIRDMLAVGSALAVIAVVLVVGMQAGRSDLAFYGVMTSVFVCASGFGVHKTLNIEAWTRESAREFLLLERVQNVGRFLLATANSITPSRALIYGLVHCVRPGRSVAIDHLVTIMEFELLRAPRILRLVGATLVQLGILGTAVGAMESLNDLSFFASGSEISAGPELFKDLLGPGSALGGLALAFGTTAMGLGANIVLRAVADTLETSSITYVNHVAGLAATFVVPDLWIDTDDPEGEVVA